MMNKNNICVIISSYPQNYLDHSLLGLTIESWRQQEYDICLVSHSPLNPDIQKASKYYIYTDENEMLEFPDISNTTWYMGNGDLLYQTNWGNTMGKHSYAILKNIQNSLHFLKSKQYSHFIYLEIDSFLSEQNHQVLNQKLEEADFLNQDYWLMMEYSDRAPLPATNFFGGKIDYFHNRLSNVDTPEKYLTIAKGCGGYSLESFFGQMFINEIEGQGYIENNPPRVLFPNEWLGASMNGQVNVPNLKQKDWWLDIVKDRYNNEKIYAILTQSAFEFKGILKIYKDDLEPTEIEITTGPFMWFLLNPLEATKWKLEHVIQGQVVKKVEYTTEEIMNNIWSFLELY